MDAGETLTVTSVSNPDNGTATITGGGMRPLRKGPVRASGDILDKYRVIGYDTAMKQLNGFSWQWTRTQA